MINLQLHRYCNDCPEFEAQKDTDIICGMDGEIISVQHKISCEHFQKCNAIYNYLVRSGKRKEKYENKT